jgi:hypothetical protein
MKLAYGFRRAIKVWLQLQARKLFARREVPKGNMLVVWRDVDDKVYGWSLPADNEFDLVQVALLIRSAKDVKTLSILNATRDQ